MLAQGVILARVLGVDGRGGLAAIVLWPNIIANIGLLGTRMSITRAAAATHDDIDPVTRAGILLSLIFSMISVVAGLALLPLLMPETSSDIMGLARTFMVLFVPASILSAILAAVDHGQGRFRRLNFFRLLQSPLFVLFLVVLIVLGRANLTYCIWASIAAFWATALGRFALLTRQLPLVGSMASLPRLIREGFPYAITGIIAQFTHRGDRILLLWLLTERDLGLYAVAFSAASVLAVVTRSMGFVSLAIAAQERAREGFDRIAQIFRGATIISVGMGIVMIAAVYLLLPVVYGREFTDARIISVVLAVGFIPYGQILLLSQIMGGQGKPMAGMISRIVGMGVMVLVAFTCSRSLGAIGVALGFLAAQAIGLCGLVMFVLRHYNSASLSGMVPTVQDAKLISRRLKQEAVVGLTKIRIILPSTTRNAYNSDNNAE